MKVPQLAKIASRASELQVKFDGVQETINRGVTEQFRIDPDKIGLIIGREGANIAKSQQISGKLLWPTMRTFTCFKCRKWIGLTAFDREALEETQGLTMRLLTLS